MPRPSDEGHAFIEGREAGIENNARMKFKHEQFERWALIGFLATQLESLDLTDLVCLADQLLADFTVEFKGF